MANQTGYRATKTFTYLEESDYCDHCSATDLSKAVGYFYENDSCGPVFRHIVCEECRAVCQKAEDEQPVMCHDCKLTVLVKDTINWRWYDFYAAQGDEPLVICKDCQGKETHIKRVARDREDYLHEFPEHDHDDQDDHDEDLLEDDDIFEDEDDGR